MASEILIFLFTLFIIYYLKRFQDFFDLKKVDVFTVYPDTKPVMGDVMCRAEPVRSSCPAKCSCTGSVVNCRNAGLMSIPDDIPDNVEEL